MVWRFYNERQRKEEDIKSKIAVGTKNKGNLIDTILRFKVEF